MRIFYIGSVGPLSLGPLQMLIDSGHEVCGLGMDWHEPGNWLEITLDVVGGRETNALVSLAQKHDIPVINMHCENFSKCSQEIRSLQPQLILVSCYAHKLPDEILNIAPMGGVNCHPSLLPEYRGPMPLFWQYRDGVEKLGVTLHTMTSEWDAGHIITSESMPVADGMDGMQINLELAQLLSETLQSVLEDYPDNTTLTSQDDSQASYHSYPEEIDFSVSTDWSARRIYNFMRATDHWGRSYPCDIDGKRYELKHALVYSKRGGVQLLPDKPGLLNINCQRGTLAASYYY